MQEETFFNYKKYRWLWINLFFLLACTVIYIVDDPIGGPNGGTYLGYTLGVVSALGIFYLIWYGVKRRSYGSKGMPLKGALSLHIWLGVMLLFLVPLHAGFQFGINLHTAVYLLMVGTVVTGIWGGVIYGRLASKVPSHRGKGSLKQLIEQFESLKGQVDQLVEGGSTDLLAAKDQLAAIPGFGIRRSLFGDPPPLLDQKQAVDVLKSISSEEKDTAVRLIELSDQLRKVLLAIHNEVAVQSWLRLWLFFHVPLAFGTLVGVIAHIFIVFHYW